MFSEKQKSDVDTSSLFKNDLSEHTCSSKFLSRFTCVCIEVINDICRQNAVRPSLFNARHQTCLNISIISSDHPFLSDHSGRFYKEFECNSVVTIFLKRCSITILNRIIHVSFFASLHSPVQFTIRKLHITRNYHELNRDFRTAIQQLS